MAIAKSAGQLPELPALSKSSSIVIVVKGASEVADCVNGSPVSFPLRLAD
jgi:hypothetical protein